MSCSNCGAEIHGGSVFGEPTCRKCAIGITIKDVLLKVVLSLGIAYILYWIAGLAFSGSANELIFTILLIGFPFGARRMFAWVVPFGGHSVAASVGILLMNVFVGALIGWAVLAYNVVATAIKTIYRVIRILAYRPVKAI